MKKFVAIILSFFLIFSMSTGTITFADAQTENYINLLLDNFEDNVIPGSQSTADMQIVNAADYTVYANNNCGFGNVLDMNDGKRDAGTKAGILYKRNFVNSESTASNTYLEFEFDLGIYATTMAQLNFTLKSGSTYVGYLRWNSQNGMLQAYRSSSDSSPATLQSTDSQYVSSVKTNSNKIDHIKIVIQTSDENGAAVNRFKRFIINDNIIEEPADGFSFGTTSPIDYFDITMTSPRNGWHTNDGNAGISLDNIVITRYTSADGASPAPDRYAFYKKLMSTISTVNSAYSDNIITDEEKTVLYGKVLQNENVYKSAVSAADFETAAAQLDSITNEINTIRAGSYTSLLYDNFEDGIIRGTQTGDVSIDTNELYRDLYGYGKMAKIASSGSNAQYQREYTADSSGANTYMEIDFDIGIYDRGGMAEVFFYLKSGSNEVQAIRWNSASGAVDVNGGSRQQSNLFKSSSVGSVNTPDHCKLVFRLTDETGATVNTLEKIRFNSSEMSFSAAAKSTQQVDSLTILLSKGSTSPTTFGANIDNLRIGKYVLSENTVSPIPDFYDLRNNIIQSISDVEGIDNPSESILNALDAIKSLFYISNVTKERVDSASANLAKLIDESGRLMTEEQFIEESELVGTAYGVKTTVDVNKEKFGFDRAFSIKCETKPSLSSEFKLRYAISSSNNTISSGDALQLSFAAKTAEDAGKISVYLENANDNSRIGGYTYYITGQWTQIYIPIAATEKATNNVYITFELGFDTQEIFLGNATFTNYGSGREVSSLKSGMYMNTGESWTNYELSDTDGLNIGKSNDVISDGNYLYVLSGSRLLVAEIAGEGKPTIVGESEYLGSVRQLEFTADKKAIMVTCRENGAYIISIADPTNPRILSHYDSVEMATGLAIAGNYAAITNRQFGVELIDISDYANPKHISLIRSGEAQSCQIVDGYLYAGVWGEQKVRIYDITDVGNPQHVSTINLNGKGDGMYVKDGILYAATGQNTEAGATYTEHPGFGLGNGMEIYDVTDPSSPKWLSTCKLDGRLYYNGNDMWRVELAEKEDGGYYAYVINSYMGVYVFDVSIPSNPKRIAHISIKIEPGSANYSYLTSSRDIVFPYDQAEYQCSPINGIAIANDTLYMAAAGSDVHSIKADFVTSQVVPDSAGNISGKGEDFYVKDFTAVKAAFPAAKWYYPNSQVYAVTKHNDKLYLSAGSRGIIILDNSLSLVQEVNTGDITQDIQIKNGILYAANGKNGLCAYKLRSDGTIAQEPDNSYISLRNGTLILSVKQIVLSPNGNYAFLHAGGAYMDVVNLNTWERWGDSQINATGGGYMYFRQLTPGLVDGRYAGGWGYNGYMFWIDFGEDNGNEPEFIRTDKLNPMYNRNGMYNSTFPYGDTKYALSLHNAGFTLIDPTDTSLTSTNQDGITVFAVKKSDGSDVNISGKGYYFDKYILVNERTLGKCYIIDAADINNLTLLETLSINGNPDISYADNENIYISAGYQGLYVLPKISVEYNRQTKKATVFSLKPQAVTAIFAAYGPHGELLSSEIQENKSLIHGSSEIYAENLDVSDAASVNILLWNDMKSLKPLTSKYSD